MSSARKNKEQDVQPNDYTKLKVIIIIIIIILTSVIILLFSFSQNQNKNANTPPNRTNDQPKVQTQSKSEDKRAHRNTTSNKHNTSKEQSQQKTTKYNNAPTQNSKNKSAEPTIIDKNNIYNDQHTQNSQHPTLYDSDPLKRPLIYKSRLNLTKVTNTINSFLSQKNSIETINYDAKTLIEKSINEMENHQNHSSETNHNTLSFYKLIFIHFIETLKVTFFNFLKDIKILELKDEHINILKLKYYIEIDEYYVFCSVSLLNYSNSLIFKIKNQKENIDKLNKTLLIINEHHSTQLKLNIVEGDALNNTNNVDIEIDKVTKELIYLYKPVIFNILNRLKNLVIHGAFKFFEVLNQLNTKIYVKKKFITLIRNFVNEFNPYNDLNELNMSEDINKLKVFLEKIKFVFSDINLTINKRIANILGELITENEFYKTKINAIHNVYSTINNIDNKNNEFKFETIKKINEEIKALPHNIFIYSITKLEVLMNRINKLYHNKNKSKIILENKEKLKQEFSNLRHIKNMIFRNYLGTLSGSSGYKNNDKIRNILKKMIEFLVDELDLTK